MGADPPRWQHNERPEGSRTLSYTRTHGWPSIYYSDYSPRRLAALGEQLVLAATESADAWCILDNTAHGHALVNALALRRRLAEQRVLKFGNPAGRR